MIESVGLQSMVEGIEMVEQATVLQDLGCLHAQGHYFGEPVDADELGWLLAAAPSLRAEGGRLAGPASERRSGHSFRGHAALRYYSASGLSPTGSHPPANSSVVTNTETA